MLLLIRHTSDFFRHASPEQSFNDCMLVRAATDQESHYRGEAALVGRLSAWLERHPAHRRSAVHATTACCGQCRAEGCRLRSRLPGEPMAVAGHAGLA